MSLKSINILDKNISDIFQTKIKLTNKKKFTNKKKLTRSLDGFKDLYRINSLIKKRRICQQHQVQSDSKQYLILMRG